jgi:hypothetical protein
VMVDVEALIRATGRTCKGGFGDRCCAAVVGCSRLALSRRSR